LLLHLLSVQSLQVFGIDSSFNVASTLLNHFEDYLKNSRYLAWG
jgi:hypothetical protein